MNQIAFNQNFLSSRLVSINSEIDCRRWKKTDELCTYKQTGGLIVKSERTEKERKRIQPSNHRILEP